MADTRFAVVALTIFTIIMIGTLATALRRTNQRLGARIDAIEQRMSTPTSTGPEPDCLLQFGFSHAGASPALDNRSLACTNWMLAYESAGFEALSIAVQTAPDVAGQPGSWQTLAHGGNITGVTLILYDSSPWLRVTLLSTTGTGTVSGRLYGWRVAARTTEQNGAKKQEAKP